MKKECKIVSLNLPIEWYHELKKMSCDLSIKSNKSITMVELIRDSIRKTYKFKD